MNRECKKSSHFFFEGAAPGITPDTLDAVLQERKKEYTLKSLILLKQVHGADGLCIESEEQASALIPRSYDGDYLITNIKNIGIGVLTADCLPIVIYDPKTESIGISHAGWRGSVQGIGIKMFEHMEQVFGVKKESVQIFFGPSAGVCCYEVDSSFLKNRKDVSYGLQTLTLKKTHNKTYFDLALFNKLQFSDIGIKEEQIDSMQNYCTIENNLFCSYRRDSSNQVRQLSFAYIT